MKARYRVAAAVATLLVLTTEVAAEGIAEPLPMPSYHLWMRSGPGVLRGPDGRDYVIPQDSHILAPEGWNMLDIEFRRLQDQETRLYAENESLRKSANEFPWVPIVVGVGIGLVAGTYVGMKFL
jgi:hypothetical protein